MQGQRITSAPGYALLQEGLERPEPESWAEHTARLGPRPRGDLGLIGALRDADLRGCGGARFPAFRKWQAVLDRPRGKAVILVNGAEGEPASWKDRILMHRRPHLVLDGALLAAEALDASEIVLYVNETFDHALEALRRALAERTDAPPRIRLLGVPDRWVSGEETAAVHFANGHEARPTYVPPRPFERGVGGRATLVQNVETMAHVALIARRSRLGAPTTSQPLLLTVSGAVSRPGVYEVQQGTGLGDVVVDVAGGEGGAILLGGFFGGWVPPARAAALRLVQDDPAVRLGCGVVCVLPASACPVVETAHVLAYLARESADQCGPCRVGLPALAELAVALAHGTTGRQGLDQLTRWARHLAHGRGACKHPDGAAGLLLGAMATFPQEFERHAAGRACRAPAGRPFLPIPLETGL